MELPEEFGMIYLHLSAYLEGDFMKLYRIHEQVSYDKPSLFERAYRWLREKDPEQAEIINTAFKNALRSAVDNLGCANNRFEELCDVFGYKTLTDVRSHLWHYNTGIAIEKKPERTKLSVNEIARMFDCSAKTVERIAKEGLIILHREPNKLRGKFTWSDEIDIDALSKRLRDS